MDRDGVATGAVLAAILMLASAPALATAKDRSRLDGWVLTVRHDRFAGRVHCDLFASNHRLRYQPQAVGFRLGHHRDTRAAWYRVDDGPAIRWQDRTATLIAAGVPIDGPGLDNPTGGWVWISLDEVRQARNVAIRANERGRTHNFPMKGLAAMLDAAPRLGCASDASFES